MINHRLHILKKTLVCRQAEIIQIILLVTSYSLLVTLIGCEAFVRKFTRKPKKELLPKQELVLVPEEYKGSPMTKDELYRQYFLFWKSWQDELINSLSVNSNHKKQVDCANEAIENLMNLRTLLNDSQNKQLDIHIDRLNNLRDLVKKDPYGNNIVMNRQNAERIRRNIQKDFSYSKIKGHLL